MNQNVLHVILNSTNAPIDLAPYIAIQVFMWVAVVLTIVLLLPAVIDIYKTNNTISISKWMYILYPICDLTWVVYAILLVYDKSVPWEEIIGIGICEFVNLIFTSYILFKKISNVRAAKYMHMTEAEWYRWTLREKAEKEKLARLGIKNRHDLNEQKNQRVRLIKILKEQSVKYNEIVDQRVVKSKEYIKNTKGEIKSAKKRLEHFINIATNADLSRMLWLIYLDIYKEK
jgi:uncharacterized protein with PQ loop repeat